MLSTLTAYSYTGVGQKLRNHAAPIIWFLLICIVIYAFYCTSKGFDFGVIANLLKLGYYN